jgi:hypothetical protein
VCSLGSATSKILRVTKEDGTRSLESSGMYCRVLNWISTDVSEVRAASIIRAMMEAARTSETSVEMVLRTRQNIPEDSELHTRSCENLKSHKMELIFKLNYLLS